MVIAALGTVTIPESDNFMQGDAAEGSGSGYGHTHNKHPYDDDEYDNDDNVGSSSGDGEPRGGKYFIFTIVKILISNFLWIK